MDLNPIKIIDRNTTEIARSLDIIVYALGGLYEQVVREKLNMAGLRWYWVESSAIIDRVVADTTNKILDATQELKASLSALDAIHVDDSVEDTDAMRGVVSDAIEAFLAQAKVSYAKRIREIIAAKAYGIDTYQNDPRVMIRSGARWNFSDFAYLTIRQMLVSWYNENKIASYAATGVEEFNLLTDDPELFYTTYRVEEYPDISEEVFHPRTTKLVGSPHVST